MVLTALVLGLTILGDANGFKRASRVGLDDAQA